MRRGQSSVEPLLVATALVLGVLFVLHWRFDTLYAVVIDVADQLEREEWFHRMVAYLENLS